MAKEPLDAVLHLPVSAILGTRAKVAALRVLSSSLVPIPYREVVRQADMAYNSVAPALTELTQLGVVEELEGGRERRVRLSPRHRIVPALLQLLRVEADFFPALRMELRHAVAGALNEGLLSAALVGEAARGVERPGEPIELLLIVVDPSAVIPVQRRFDGIGTLLLGTFGATLALRCYDAAQARQMWRTRTASAAAMVATAELLGGQPLVELLEG